MRIGIVCPYEWTVPGGVGAHVRGLAAELRGLGHTVDVLAPAERPVADERFVAGGGYDLLHVHEPLSPSVGLLAVAQARVPVVGTFHANLDRSVALRAGSPLLRRAYDRLAARIAVS